VVLHQRNEVGRTRVGLTVSRKVGNAVVRNRVKRWLREAIRRQLGRPVGRPSVRTSGALGPRDVVFIARRGAADAGYHALSEQVATALARIHPPPSQARSVS